MQWIICEYFKVSDTDESVLDLNEILKVEMKNDNAQSFNTRWEETVIAMKYDPDDEIWDFVYHRQLQLSEQLKSLLPLYIFKILFKRVNLKTTSE